MGKEISSLWVGLTGNISGLSKTFGEAISPVTGLVSGLKSAGSSIAGVGSSLLAFTGIGAVVAAGLGAAQAALGGLSEGIKLAADLEQTSIAFETLLGSAGAAKAVMGELKTFAASTPFQFPEIANSAKQLLNAGVSADALTGRLRMLGDISAGSGKPLEELARLYAKIGSTGKLTGETLQSLAEGGVPIYKALSKQLGIAQSEVAKLVSTGAVGFKDVDAALAGLTAEGGVYYNLTLKQSKTLGGVWSTLTDNFTGGVASIVTTVAEAFSLKDGIAALSGAFETVGGLATALVTNIAPVVKSFAVSAYQTFVGIYQAAAPVLVGLFDFMAEIWTAMGRTVWGAGKAIYDITASLWGSVGDATTGFFSTAAEWAVWWKDQVVFAFRVAEYAVTNWRTTLDLVGTSMALALVTAANVSEYYLTEVIPAYAVWFGQTIADTFKNVFNFTTTIFTNIGKNIVAVFSNLPGLIKGTVNFSDLWTPLTDGFTVAFHELPKIADRQAGDLEKALVDQRDRAPDAWGDGFGKMLAEREGDTKKASERIGSALSEAFKMPEAPKVPPLTVGAKVDPENMKLTVTPEVKLGKAVFAGSAESQALRFSSPVLSAAVAAPPSVAAPAISEGMQRASDDFAKGQFEETRKQTAILTEILRASIDGIGGSTPAVAQF